MHARAGIFLDRLGHEAGGDAVPARLRPHQPLQHDEIVGCPHHVLAVVQRQLVLARRIFGNDRLGRNALRLGRGIDVGEQRLHAVQMVDRIDLGLAASCGRRARRVPAAPCPRRRAHWRAGRIRARRRRPDAGPWPPICSTCLASASRGSDDIGGRRDDTSPSAPGRAADLCRRAAPACRGSARPCRSPSPVVQISPVSCTSSPVMSRPRIEIGMCRPPSKMLINSCRRMILPRPTPLASVSTMSKASISGWASRKALRLGGRRA